MTAMRIIVILARINSSTQKIKLTSLVGLRESEKEDSLRKRYEHQRRNKLNLTSESIFDLRTIAKVAIVEYASPTNRKKHAQNKGSKKAYESI